LEQLEHVARPERRADVTARSASSWLVALEYLIGTPAEAAAWQRYSGVVRRLRALYVRLVVLLGAIVGVVAGLGAALARSLWEDDRLFGAILVGAVLAFATGWSHLFSATVAPLLRRPRHVWPPRLFVVLYEAALLSGLVVRRSLAWSVLAGLMVAAPWWVSAVLEWRQPLPARPAARD
jgi:hypothetical protein